MYTHLYMQAHILLLRLAFPFVDFLWGALQYCHAIALWTHLWKVIMIIEKHLLNKQSKDVVFFSHSLRFELHCKRSANTSNSMLCLLPVIHGVIVYNAGSARADFKFHLTIFIPCVYLFVCGVCVHMGCVHITVHVWKSENTFQESSLLPPH